MVIVGLLNGDLLDPISLKDVIKKYQPISIIHFTAFTYVRESISNLNLYYNSNIHGTLNLINSMLDTGIKNINFQAHALLMTYQIESP